MFARGMTHGFIMPRRAGMHTAAALPDHSMPASGHISSASVRHRIAMKRRAFHSPSFFIDTS
jgi:hypothetical protein